MPRFRKKPVEIEAVLWTGENQDEMTNFIGEAIWWDRNEEGHRINLNVNTLEGVMAANMGDWIIRGIAGEFYPCKPDVFEATYESV